MTHCMWCMCSLNIVNMKKTNTQNIKNLHKHTECLNEKKNSHILSLWVKKLKILNNVFLLLIFIPTYFTLKTCRCTVVTGLKVSSFRHCDTEWKYYNICLMKLGVFQCVVHLCEWRNKPALIFAARCCYSRSVIPDPSWVCFTSSVLNLGQTFRDFITSSFHHF